MLFFLFRKTSSCMRVSLQAWCSYSPTPDRRASSSAQRTTTWPRSGWPPWGKLLVLRADRMTKLLGRKADETSHFSWAADTDALPTCAKISCDSYSSTPQLYYFLMNKFPHNHGMKNKKKKLLFLCYLGTMHPYLLSMLFSTMITIHFLKSQG